MSGELNWDDPDYKEPERTSYNDKHYMQHDDRDRDDHRDGRGRRGGRDGGGGGGYQGRRSYDQPKESRYENSSGGGGGRRGGGKQFNDTIDIDSACFGMVIGRGGSNVQRLQNDYNVNVQLDKNNGSCTVSGDIEGDVKSAIEDIQRHVDKGGSRQQSDRYGGGGNSDRGGQQRDRGKNDFYSSGGRSNYRQMDEEPRQTSSFYGSEQNEDDGAPSGPIDWDALNAKAETERKARWAKCPPLTKNFYNEHPEVTALTKEEVAEIRRENNNITVARVFKPADGQSENIPKPVYKFEHCFAAYPDLLEEIYKQNFERPSPIQSQAWPVLLKGEDMIGIAQTGTGKTLAFLLPAMIHTEYQSIPRRQRKGPNVLIMAPTRELALQIEKEVNKYSFRGMKAVCVYGGGDRREQISNVEEGVEIIICTPGRLNDLIQAKVIEVSSITYLVLDEADRMLDMGFEPQIRKVLLDIRPDRQTIMTSATWPPGVRRLAQSYMENPIQVCVGSLDLAATHSVRQVIEIMDDCDKVFVLRKFIQEMEPDDKIIIFCGKKVRADDLSSDLVLDGIQCQCIHGSRDQRDREQAIADITSGEVRILIATDVASRGLDIEDVTHVINFDFPRNIEEYVHRVGRTGRAGRTGTSISYITREDWGVAADLINILEEADQEVPSELRDMSKRFAAMKERRNNELDKAGFGRRGGGRGGGGGGGRSNRY